MLTIFQCEACGTNWYSYSTNCFEGTVHSDKIKIFFGECSRHNDKRLADMPAPDRGDESVGESEVSAGP